MDPSSAKKRGRDDLPPTNAEKRPLEIDESRLAKRKYAQEYRSRRQSHMEQLEKMIENLEAEIAQKNELFNGKEVENSTIRSENAALKQRRDDKAARARSIQEEAEKLTAEIEKLKTMIEAKRRETENDPDYLKFKEDNKIRYRDALGLFFPDSNMPPQ